MRHRLGGTLLALLVFGGVFIIAQSDQGGSQETVAQARPILHYTLPPDKLPQSYALYRINVSLYVITTLYSFLLLYLMLRTGFAAAVSQLAKSVSRFRIVQAAVVVVLLFVTLDVLQLPFEIYQHHIRLQYGLSVQQWGSWFGDWGKALLLTLIAMTFLGWLLYAVMRRSLRRWWFYFWLATIPFLLFVIFIEPIWIDPLFNKFEPLTDRHADLVEQIERVVNRAGMNIPRIRMYEMKASEKTNELNAYVTGFGSTKRVVVWDTTMRHLDTPQTLFVFGHEMGHYVLGHIVKGLVFVIALLLLLFYLTDRLANWIVGRYGPQWGISQLGDWASAPLLFLLLSLLTFAGTPLFNAVSRSFEHQADQYGVEVIHGMVPDAQRSSAEAFQVLGERSLDYPYVGKFAEIWLWDHPTIADRMIFVQTYNPWAKGRQPQFVKGEK